MKRILITLALSSLLAGAAHAEDTLARIKASGKITVATEAAFKPFEYVEDGKITGFGSELLAEFAKDLGVEVEQLDLPFQGILSGLAAKQYDLVATSVTPNAERAKAYAFSRPFAAIDNNVVVLSDNDSVKQLSDLNGLLVGTQLGSSTDAVARQMNDELKTGGGSGFSDLRLLQSYPDTAFNLSSGQVDAIVVPNITAAEFMKTTPDAFKVTFSYGKPAYLSWVTRPEDKTLLEAVNATITRLVKSGKIAEMQKKWVGLESATPEEGYLPENAVQLKQ
ncbi:transporter substrate-binding domain-containing protein [Agrobacterium tumefaciens]|uniref:Polar amino acid transport system substrate-binding protein n=1 Tax=Agrobacterium tumefaciens TaxID=358 RepID=A0A2L2LL14_AGRTU|nr:transporter substrate-binding domain-containing protein [Agrobacterium tumefaciens]AVH44999.1 polar amino acid transport system substrate-binding protein [Agrobacterium tumefaciens]NSY98892.1 transporter substrate-binding domain-containing protein [Agrobacterium tumefaciens]